MGRPSATGFILGALGGALVGNFALQWWGARRTGLRITFGMPDFRHPACREYLTMAIPLMLGQSIVVLDETIGKIVAASAADGSIFVLNLARRVNMLPVGVIAQAAGVAAYPYLARLVAEGRRSELLESMGRTIRMVIFVGGAAVAAVIAVSRPAIRAAFQHGEFSAEGTVLASAALIGYSLSIPAWGVQQVFGRGFYAHRRMWIPVVVGTAWTVPAIPLFILGLRIGGVPGVAVASSVVMTGHAVTLGLAWIRFQTTEGLGGVMRSVGHMSVGAGLAAVAGWLSTVAITGGRTSGFSTAVAATVVGLVVVGVVYAATTWLLGSPEARSVLRRRWPSRW